MPPAKSRKVLPSTSVSVAPDARSTKIGTTSVLAFATTASLRAIHAREIGPGISVWIRIDCSTVLLLLARERPCTVRPSPGTARTLCAHRTIRRVARASPCSADHRWLERYRPRDRRGSAGARDARLDRLARPGPRGPRRAHTRSRSISPTPDAAARAVDDHVREHGRLDVLVNAAGVARAERIDEISTAALDLQIALNVRATVAVCTAALPHLRAQRGLIVNVASILGLHGDPCAVRLRRDEARGGRLLAQPRRGAAA